MPYKPGQRVADPSTGRVGKVVFISPVTKRVYLEFDRQLPFVTYSVEQLGDLFGKVVDT